MSMKAAGVNLIRVAGSTAYAPTRFYERCSELGIMVWQDLMFANLDVPMEAPGMLDAVVNEVEMVARRIAVHGCVVALCGGSEVEQQVAMTGGRNATLQATPGRTVLKELAGAHVPWVSYVSSSPTAVPGAGGQLSPHHVSSGFSHYFGVGAYRRGLGDARRSGVGFATECLAYAHVPSSETVDRLMGEEGYATHHPNWKRGVPRDRGAGWDFDDVRDHALKELFDVDPTELRWTDPLGYLQLSRCVTAEVFDATFSEWRRPASPCNGALIWTARDLFDGAGWGITEADGTPKSAWFAMARRCAPIAVALTNEGLNGVDCHIVNDHAETLDALLTVGVFNRSTLVVERETPIMVAGRSAATRSVNELLGDHRDLTGAYGFGPAAHDLIRVKLTWEAGVSAAHLWPAGRPASSARGDTVTTEVVRSPGADDTWLVRVSSATGAFGVCIDGPGWHPSTNWFHLAPGDEEMVLLTSARPNPSRRITVRAISAPASSSVMLGGGNS